MNKKQPVYDERVNKILKELLQGKDREQIAQELEYSTYKSLDMYMRRKNFKWDRHKNTYVPEIEMEQDKIEIPSSSKVAMILRAFEKEDANAKEIAKNMGFQDHVDLAEYMKGKGYVYSSEQDNYVKFTGEIVDKYVDDDVNVDVDIDEYTDETSTPTPLPDEFGKYMHILKMLSENEDRLIDLLIPKEDSGRIPRFIVGGRCVTKSVHMSHKLDDVVRDFSATKGIAQKDIFAVALIEFFRRYGFEREVNTMLEG